MNTSNLSNESDNGPEQSNSFDNSQMSPTKDKKQDIPNDECVFSWGEYGSTYSTDFTGYTSGEFEYLDESESSDQIAHHHEKPHFTSSEVKPKSIYTIQGTIHNLSGLININNDKGEKGIYVTIQLFGQSSIEKGKKTPIRTPIVRNSLSPVFDFDFKFDNARKGDSICINVFQWQNGQDDVMIGTVRMPVKDNEGEKEIVLLRPLKLEENGIIEKFGSYGKVKLTIHSEKTQNFTPTEK